MLIDFVLRSLFSVAQVWVGPDPSNLQPHHFQKAPGIFDPFSATSGYTLPPWITTTERSSTAFVVHPSSYLPNKHDVWAAQLYCDRVGAEFGDHFSRCSNLTSSLTSATPPTSSIGLRNLLSCAEGVLRLQEASCACVWTSLNVFGWRDEDSATICSPNLKTCSISSSGSVESLQNSFKEIGSLLAKSEGYLSEGDSTIEPILNNGIEDNSNNDQNGRLEHWGGIMTRFGRTIQQIGDKGMEFCAQVKHLIANFHPIIPPINPNDNLLPKVWRQQQLCNSTQAQLAKQFNSCSNKTIGGTTAQLQDMLSCIQQVEEWERSTCSCVHAGLQLIGMTNSTIEGVCSEYQRNCVAISSGAVVADLNKTISTKFESLRHLLAAGNDSLNLAGNELTKAIDTNLTLAQQTSVLTTWANDIILYGEGQDEFGAAVDNLCGTLATLIANSTKPPPSNGTTIIVPSKEDVWRVQQQCDLAEVALDAQYNCKNWTVSDGLQGLESLLLCMQLIERFEEKTCSCVKSGLRLYPSHWNETTLDKVCYDGVRQCNGQLYPDWVNKTEDSMTLETSFQVGIQQLASAKKGIEAIISGPTTNQKEEQDALQKWERDIQLYGRTRDTLGQNADQACIAIKAAITYGSSNTTPPYSPGHPYHGGGQGGSGAGGGGCPWWAFLFCWIGDIFGSFHFPNGDHGNPDHNPDHDTTTTTLPTTTTTTSTTTTTTETPPSETDETCQKSLESNNQDTENELKECEKELNKLEQSQGTSANDTDDAICCLQRVVENSFQGEQLSELGQLVFPPNSNPDLPKSFCSEAKGSEPIEPDTSPWDLKSSYDRIKKTWSDLRDTFTNGTAAVKRAADFMKQIVTSTKMDNSTVTDYKKELTTYASNTMTVASLASTMMAVVMGYPVRQGHDRMVAGFEKITFISQTVGTSLDKFIQGQGIDERRLDLETCRSSLVYMNRANEEAIQLSEVVQALIPVVIPEDDKDDSDDDNPDNPVLRQSPIGNDVASLQSIWGQVTTILLKIDKETLPSAGTELNSSLDKMELLNTTYSKYSEILKEKYEPSLHSISPLIQSMLGLISKLEEELTTTTTPAPPTWLQPLEDYMWDIKTRLAQLRHTWEDCKGHFSPPAYGLEDTRTCAKAIIPFVIALHTDVDPDNIRRKFNLPANLRRLPPASWRHRRSIQDLPYEISGVDKDLGDADNDFQAANGLLKSKNLSDMLSKMFALWRDLGGVQINLSAIVDNIQKILDASTTTTPPPPPAWLASVQAYMYELKSRLESLSARWSQCKASYSLAHLEQLRDCSSSLASDVLSLHHDVDPDNIRASFNLPASHLRRRIGPLGDAVQDLERDIPFKISAADSAFSQSGAGLHSADIELLMNPQTPDNYLTEMFHVWQAVGGINTNLAGIVETIQKIFAQTTTTTPLPPTPPPADAQLKALSDAQVGLEARFLGLLTDWNNCKANPNTKLEDFGNCLIKQVPRTDQLIANIVQVEAMIDAVPVLQALGSPLTDAQAELAKLVTETNGYFNSARDYLLDGGKQLETATNAKDAQTRSNYLAQFKNRLEIVKALVDGGIKVAYNMMIEKVKFIIQNTPPPPPEHHTSLCCKLMFICCIFD